MKTKVLHAVCLTILVLAALLAGGQSAQGMESKEDRYPGPEVNTRTPMPYPGGDIEPTEGRGPKGAKATATLPPSPYPDPYVPPPTAVPKPTRTRPTPVPTATSYWWTPTSAPTMTLEP